MDSEISHGDLDPADADQAVRLYSRYQMKTLEIAGIDDLLTGVLTTAILIRTLPNSFTSCVERQLRERMTRSMWR